MPRLVISPSLLALGIELDHMFGSRWLSIQLLKFGFGENYHEINRFKETIVANASVEQLLKSHTSEGFLTFIGNNVYHNVAILDGKGNFHGMGIIAAITNEGQINTQHVIRERPKTIVKVADKFIIQIVA